MVLRGKPVGEQGAADRWTALSRRCGAGPSGAPLLFSFPVRLVFFIYHLKSLDAVAHK